MGAYLTFSRYPYVEDQIKGKIESLGLFEVERDNYNRAIESIEVKGMLKVFLIINSGEISGDTFWPEFKEKLFLNLIHDQGVGAGFHEDANGEILATFQSPDAGLSLVKKIIDYLDYFKQLGYIDNEEERSLYKYEENFILNLHDFFEKAVEEKNIIYASFC